MILERAAPISRLAVLLTAFPRAAAWRGKRVITHLTACNIDPTQLIN